MTTLWAAAFAAGCGVGLGFAVLIWSLAVPDRPALVALLDRAASRPAAVIAVDREPDGPEWSLQLRRRAAALLDRTWIPVPTKDLAVMERSRSSFVLQRAGLFLFGLLVVPLMSVLLWFIGAPVPPAIPAIASIGLAVALAILAGAQVKAAAAKRRRDMKHALVAYLALIALHRAAGAGAAASLELAASSSQAWAFRRIDRQVGAALRSQRTAWQGLQDLADELEIEELADLSSIAESGGLMGAQIGATLMARARSLRNELLTKEQEEAAVATNSMTFPKVLLGLVVVIFILFPTVWTLVTSPTL